MFNFEAFWQTLTEQTVLFGPKILFAFTTLIFGNSIAKTISWGCGEDSSCVKLSLRPSNPSVR